MTKEKLKEEFINSFGEEKWKQEEMLSKLFPIHKEIAEFLGMDMIPVICEDIQEDSRFYYKEQYIVISTRMLEKYSDVVKSLVHELRHQYQALCISNPNTKENLKLVKLWKKWKSFKKDILINKNQLLNILKEALEKMKLLGFKTLKEYFEYLNYMKSKGYKY